MSDNAIVPAVEVKQDEHFLIARNPQEMSSAQAELVSFFALKVKQEENELLILCDAVDHAKKNKWGVSALNRQISLTRGRKVFYEKALDASKEGFTLIPNVPCDVFAVRVNRYGPQHETEQRYNHNKDVLMPVDSGKLPSGEGRYESALAEIASEKRVEQIPGKEAITRYFATAQDYRDVQFPLIAARPAIMDTTALAMSKKM
jgi:hypothetical protein